MEQARGEAPRTWLPWGLLAGVVVLAGVGGWLASRSIAALLARTAQLEHEAAESEARVAELQAQRDALERRLRALERQQAPRAPAARTEAASAPRP